MRGVEFLDENQPILEPETIEALKLAATYKAVGEACVQLNAPQAETITIEVADDVAPFSQLLGGPYSPYKDIYTPVHFRAETEYLKSFGFTGRAAKLAVDSLHDNRYYVSNLFSSVSEVRDGLTVRTVVPEHTRSERSISVTVNRPDKLKRAAEKGWCPYDQISGRAVVELLLWYGRNKQNIIQE